MPYKDPEKHREYMRAWRTANSEKYLEYNREAARKFRKANPDRVRAAGRERSRKWYAENREARREQSRKWYTENREAKNKRSREWGKANPEKRRAAYQKFRKANPDRVRSTTLRHKYNITLEEFQAMRLEQCNRCAICGVEFDDTKHKLKPCVDHDHKTHKVRALLCCNCNSGIGKLQESRQVLLAAVEYLDRHAALGRNEPTHLTDLSTSNPP